MNLSWPVRRGSQGDRFRASGAASPVELTFVCTDVVDFTGITQRLGDQRSLEAMRRLARIVRHETGRHRGSELELQGDAFLLAFATPHAGVRCAVAIQRALARQPILDEGIRLEVRISIHTGSVLRDGEGYFGANMIVPYRMLEKASAGEIVVSGATSAQVGDRFPLTPGRSFLAKGFSQEMQFRSVNWSPADATPERHPHPQPTPVLQSRDESPRTHAA